MGFTAEWGTAREQFSIPSLLQVPAHRSPVKPSNNNGIISADWSSLPSDLVNRIAGCLLATNDVDYYMDFRAVCSTWRSATTDTKNNPDKRFHPSRWVVIDEVSSVDVEDRTRLLVNTATGRVLRKDLPMLRKYYIIVTTGGFFVLADKKPPHATRVLNPLTGYLLRFMAPMVTEKVAAAAAVAGPTLICFATHAMVCFLVESAGQMLMIFKLQERMEVFKVDNDISTPQAGHSASACEERIGNRAIFLGYRQCLFVNADKFQMVEANCIYYFLSSYTFNAWGSELESAKNLDNFIPNAKDFGLSSYLEDLEFGD
ncbi:uncharacterized protein LOC124660046 [Lolium rigidum]|uniref:uncharacterized protein LOC124660046 n=1 Tax=Lolium rigidum TaxID=89674 RepID=UPI001F5C436D|nr:uncharacterized protein LOC124660046 [Lolium rigidum]